MKIIKITCGRNPKEIPYGEPYALAVEQHVTESWKTISELCVLEHISTLILTYPTPFTRQSKWKIATLFLKNNIRKKNKIKNKWINNNF